MQRRPGLPQSPHDFPGAGGLSGAGSLAPKVPEGFLNFQEYRLSKDTAAAPSIAAQRAGGGRGMAPLLTRLWRQAPVDDAQNGACNQADTQECQPATTRAGRMGEDTNR
jgi:hypothetical protein